MKYYKIVDTVTDLYSNGGKDPTFSLHGKVWKGKDNLERHLTMVDRYGNSSSYEHCEIVQYSLTPVSSIPYQMFKLMEMG